MGDETGWDLGPFATVLQCLHLDIPFLEQQNTKKLYVIKKQKQNPQYVIWQLPFERLPTPNLY